MRFPYTPFAYDGRVYTRPCAKIRIHGDPSNTTHDGLLDSGSIHTIIRMDTLRDLGVSLGLEEGRVGRMGFGGLEDMDVPVHRLSLQIVPPHPRWKPIELPDITVACTAREELPFVILGASALAHLVIVVRDYDQIVHVKAAADFANARHYRDDGF